MENPGDPSLGKDRGRDVELFVQPVELTEGPDHFLHVAVDIHEGFVGGLQFTDHGGGLVETFFLLDAGELFRGFAIH